MRSGVFTSDQSANITALAAELSVIEPERVLTSISAVYTGGDVEVGTAVIDLTGITVTAHYSDGSSEIVTDYSLFGEIIKGENSIIVIYEDMTTAFTVIGIPVNIMVEDITLGVAVSYKETAGMYINVSSATLPRATLIPVG